MNRSRSLLAEKSFEGQMELTSFQHYVFRLNWVSNSIHRGRAWRWDTRGPTSSPRKSPGKVFNKVVHENENFTENEHVAEVQGRGGGRFLRGGLGRRRLSPAVKGASVC